MGTNATGNKKIIRIEDALNKSELLLAKQAAILSKNFDTELTYTLTGVELWMLHGTLRLGADHPGFQDLSEYAQAIIKRFREFCINVWVEMGLTPEEARALDEMRD